MGDELRGAHAPAAPAPSPLGGSEPVGAEQGDPETVQQMVSREKPSESGPSTADAGLVCEPACEPLRESRSPTSETRAPGRDTRFGYGPGRINPQVGRATQKRGSEPKHGVRRFEDTGALSPELAARQADDLAGLVADLGGVTELTTAKRALVEKAAEVLTITRLFAEDIAARGAFTARGRVRATTTGYLNAVDRVVRVLGVLGLERKARRVDTLEDYIARTRTAQGTRGDAGEGNEPGEDSRPATEPQGGRDGRR